MKPAGLIIDALLLTFLILMFARFIVDWVMVFARSWSPSGPILVLLEVVYSVTDPPIKAMRRVIPTLRIGSIALDLGFIAVIVIVYVLRYINDRTLLAV